MLLCCLGLPLEELALHEHVFKVTTLTAFTSNVSADRKSLKGVVRIYEVPGSAACVLLWAESGSASRPGSVRVKVGVGVGATVGVEPSA